MEVQGEGTPSPGDCALGFSWVPLAGRTTSDDRVRLRLPHAKLGRQVAGGMGIWHRHHVFPLPFGGRWVCMGGADSTCFI